MEVKVNISGYRQLTEGEQDLINEIKEQGNNFGLALDVIGGLPGTDQRWLAIARTDLQKGFMSLIRAIANPTGF